jgi:hypothetical protein
MASESLSADARDQFRQAQMPPIAATARLATDPAANGQRQPSGGRSWAQPNQLEAKKPRMRAVVALSRIDC